MEVLDAIQTRRTVGKLVEPAPDEAALARAFSAAVAAPDHKRLRPWRFLVVAGDARKQFGTLLANAMKSRAPSTSEADLERESGKALRAPMIIVVVASIKEGVNIPDIEQTLAVGAATQNLMLALHAQGYGTAWKTGAGSYSDVVRKGLGLGDRDQIIGFVYVGSVNTQPPATTPIAWQDFVTDWNGPAR